MGPPPRNTRPAYENDEILIYNTAEGLKIRNKRDWRLRLIQKSAIALSLLALVGGGGGWWVHSQMQPPHPYPAEEFRLAVNRAIAAADLTQTAASYQEWATIAAWWQQAADLMRGVPRSHRQYALAQDKVLEYSRNYQYALAKAAEEPIAAVTATGLWSIGDRRGQLFTVQGSPDRQMDYGTQCREVVYYKNSRVELQQGVVTGYDNVDNNLRVDDQVAIAPSPATPAQVWSLASPRDQVLQIQGSPTQVLNYDSINQTTVYYGRSYIEFKRDAVIGYSNVENNLKVVLSAGQITIPTPQEWQLNSTQDEVLQIQGTPTQVVQDQVLCRERYYYGNSVVEFRNGELQGYDNLDRNLKVP